MPQRPIEIILARQLASYLAVPILIVDREQNLLFFNEPAEPILGRRFDETGEIQRFDTSKLLHPTDASGNPIPYQEQVLWRAMKRNEPSHRRVHLTGLDGVKREVEGLGFPLETRDAGLLGAMLTFWEVKATADRDPAPPTPPKRPPEWGHPVEVILLRRLFDRLTMPAFVIDDNGRLIFYNPAAEPLIGRPFLEVGPIESGDWYDIFQPTDEDGAAIKRENHLMYAAMHRLEPSYRRFMYQSLDGVKRRCEGTAFPLVGQGQRRLGAVGIFWEVSR
jgi:PAS domain-containing protein